MQLKVMGLHAEGRRGEKASEMQEKARDIYWSIEWMVRSWRKEELSPKHWANLGPPLPQQPVAEMNAEDGPKILFDMSDKNAAYQLER